MFFFIYQRSLPTESASSEARKQNASDAIIEFRDIDIQVINYKQGQTTEYIETKEKRIK